MLLMTHTRRTKRLMNSTRTQPPLCAMDLRPKHHFAAWLALAVFTVNCSAQIVWYTPKPEYSIAQNWNERALEGIRMDTPHPPVQARNLFSFPPPFFGTATKCILR